MHIIQNGNDEIEKVWYRRKIDTSTCYYRITKFLLEKKISNRIVLCNTVTGELVYLSKEEEICYRQLPGSYQDELHELILRKYVVPFEYDELTELNRLKNIFRHNNKNASINNYTVLPTTYCNARCFYCYQNGMKQIHMSENTANKLIDFIDCHSNHTNVNLAWFGGEPLIGYQRINQICEGLTQRNIQFTSIMTSNCSLFDEAKILTAKDNWHLKKVQVTLDGTAPIYNDVKAYVGFQGDPFQQVISNIDFLIKQGITTSIRLNLDTHNEDDLIALIEDLGKRFSGKKNLYVYVSLLKENVGQSPVHHSKKETVSLLQRGYDLEQRIINAGLRSRKAQELPHLKLSNCMANNPYTIQCSPDGKLGKCEDQVFLHTIGSLEQGIIDEHLQEWWGEEELYTECKSCAFVPYCPHLKNCPLNKQFCEPINREKTYSSHLKLMEDIYNRHIKK